MRPLSEEGHRIVSEIAQRHDVSTAAVAHLLVAVMAGNGSQAQFNHPDLGGMGQWSRGGMIMIGDMFNNGLKAKVDALCNELSALVRNPDLFGPATSSYQSQSQGGSAYQDQYQGDLLGSGVSLFVPGSQQRSGGWPEELGQPSSTGAQNNLRYAFFPAMRRLLIDNAGRITVYDTRDHQIGGFSQQQGGDQSLTFTSQYGLVRVADLEIVSPAQDRPDDAPPPSTAFPPRTETFAAAATPDEPDWDAPEESHAVAPAPIAAPVAVPSPAPEPIPAPIVASNGSSNAPAFQPSRAETRGGDDIIGMIERLAGLRDKGILTAAEFEAKKTELLGRL
ncbi:SHOCT domain-containing protein [Rhizobium sp. RU36D]|uniref:SHOCT domain-containing protein n=1 Tax=Rhizobium sp. RU36D TaxID=1907415 RepID=UPI0009D87B54|nr:SHOCT domain-containing protein [Rhizobium sp. RU36D]SMD19079.1 Short C-terminal domain-containing protein [Rhizobium sp. RU36D]